MKKVISHILNYFTQEPIERIPTDEIGLFVAIFFLDIKDIKESSKTKISSDK